MKVQRGRRNHVNPARDKPSVSYVREMYVLYDALVQIVERIHKSTTDEMRGKGKSQLKRGEDYRRVSQKQG